MNKVFHFILLLIFAVSCQPTNSEKSIDASAIETDSNATEEPIMSFEKKTWDFGSIIDGEVVEHTFRFTNTGNKDLVISSASASCGCTIPNWPKEPIAPGDKGEIKVKFNSSGKKDMVTKDITILANTNPVKTILQIKVFVETKKS